MQILKSLKTHRLLQAVIPTTTTWQEHQTIPITYISNSNTETVPRRWQDVLHRRPLVHAPRPNCGLPAFASSVMCDTVHGFQGFGFHISTIHFVIIGYMYGLRRCVSAFVFVFLRIGCPQQYMLNSMSLESPNCRGRDMHAQLSLPGGASFFHRMPFPVESVFFGLSASGKQLFAPGKHFGPFPVRPFYW